MKFVSWNVNGLKACLNKGFMNFFERSEADFFCVQETKLQENFSNLKLEGYHEYWSHCERKGYSGTAIFAKYPAIDVKYGMGISEFDVEGRLITLEYDEFYLINVYTPNAKQDASRLDFRVNWDAAFKKLIERLNNNKLLIICGDMNVSEMNVKRPVNARVSFGFSSEECEEFTNLLNSIALVDTFKYLYPKKESSYTWRSYSKQKRGENSGWRIDYFLISEYLLRYLKDSYICTDVLGSDHLPIVLEMKLSF
ncbi:MAG: exodeoxyribonuclease III [Oscillospiraceae bacterium]|jgi:exodeoxyribonuclease-3|nr:exodeoxyribonuclease III [Oscillospiraceae bacterium]